MTGRLTLEPISPPRPTVLDLEGLVPKVVDREYLAELGVTVRPSDGTVAALIRGSRAFSERLERGTLLPRPRIEARPAPADGDLGVHNYTGSCPTATYEVNPVVGCSVGCLYCLVSDGDHEEELVLLEGYPELLARVLERRLGERCFYYFSPKTEAFQDATLQTGVAHGVLRVFIEHFRTHPESGARLFVATKAGTRQLAYEHEGESVLDLLADLRGRMQLNTSVSIMPAELRELLEPGAPELDDRLDAVRLCQERGLLAGSALVQPIVLPALTDGAVDEMLRELRDAGIVNWKPELLTVSMENLAIIGQILGFLDKGMERELYEAYVAPGNADHKKQRDRTAPSRAASAAAIRKLVAAAEAYGISTSVCHWVRKELNLSEELIPIVNRNGYQCLGYQTRLLEG